jgi:hypothetical protein
MFINIHEKVGFRKAVELFLSAWSHETIKAEKLRQNCIDARDRAEMWFDGLLSEDGDGSERDVALEIHRTFGAPGDFGYETMQGQSLALLYNNVPKKEVA